MIAAAQAAQRHLDLIAGRIEFLMDDRADLEPGDANISAHVHAADVGEDRDNLDRARLHAAAGLNPGKPREPERQQDDKQAD